MRGKDTKERIVEEAFALFASRGFHAVSVRDIAAAVGIKDASLYNHFSGKQAIFDAIVRDALERTRRFFGERSILFDVSDDATPYEEMNAERMHEMVLPSFRYFFEDPYMVRLRHLLVISQFESEEAGRVYRLVFVEQPMALQRTIFEHLMATGEFVRDDAAQMAVELQGVPFMLMHAGLTWEEAEPRLAAHVERFARAHTAAGGAFEEGSGHEHGGCVFVADGVHEALRGVACGGAGVPGGVARRRAAVRRKRFRRGGAGRMASCGRARGQEVACARP